METFKANTNSWHYKIVRNKICDMYNSNRVADELMPKDFCSYWRIVFGVCLIYGLAITIFGGAVLALIGALLYGLIFDTAAFLSGTGVVLLVIAITFGIVYGLTTISNKIKEDRKKKANAILHGEPLPEPEYGFFMTKYYAFKNKICPNVEYK